MSCVTARVMRTTGVRFFALAVGVGILVSGTVRANDEVPHEARGYERSGYELSAFENINLANGNLTFRIPLASIHTDGALGYELALHHNSKVWFTHRYCSLTPIGYQGCEGSGGDILEAEIAHGVEAFGFGWDMRPPRVVLYRTTPFVRGMAFVESSGAKHGLSVVPPWEMENDPANPPGSEAAIGDRFYTQDGSNLRFTVVEVDGDGRPVVIEMENGSGDLYVFAQVVPTSCDVDRGVVLGDDLDDFNFRIETAGLYLTEIQRGPWTPGSTRGEPANRILFAYRGPSATWSAPCGGQGAEPWLPSRVSAGGEVTRELEILYDPATSTLSAIRYPGFNPVIGDPGPTPNVHEIQIHVGEATYDQKNGPDRPQFSAAHLERVQYPDGTAFVFDADHEAGMPPMTDVVLPSGAHVDYSHGSYPVGRGRCEDGFEGGDDCINWTTCGVFIPRRGEHLTAALDSTGVTRRRISYDDAATEPGSPRRRTTWFMQGLNCAVDPQFTRPPNQLLPWPYDFDWALRDDQGRLHAAYLWTAVYTAAGEAGPDTEGTLEIHRFHPLTREEFSVDHLAGDSETLAGMPWMTISGWEDLRGTELRVLRHLEIERELKFGIDFPTVTQGEDRYSYIRQRRVFTDETGDSGVADVESCYPPVWVDLTGPPSVTIDCTEVRVTQDVDDFLNITVRAMASARTASQIEVERTWRFDYLPPAADSDWYLHREIASDVCEQGVCATRIRDWNNLSEPGYRRWYAPAREVENPGTGGGCVEDCLEQSYGYDTVGNRESVTVKGGYGTGFGSLDLVTRTVHRHGRPVAKEVLGGGASLVLWHREVDPGTGLTRWHLSGSGAGYAYDYDGRGRLSAIAPIDGDSDGGSWSLDVQRTDDGEALIGSRIDYLVPSTTEMLRHEVHEATFELVPSGGGLRLHTVWQDPTSDQAFFFDGLGRLSRRTERYPSGTGSRSRLSLDLLWNGQAPCGGGGVSGLDHTSRVTLESEWRDDGQWSSCSDFDWTTTLFDALDRPVTVRLPDGTESFQSYVGDGQHILLRSVGTGASGAVDWFASIRVDDPLGRLRGLDEEVAPGERVTADYDYDHLDRLVAAHFWEGEPHSSEAQHRRFDYSDGGFLLSTVEPEREVVFHGYDAAGHLRAKTTGGITSTFGYDPLGRPVARSADGFPVASWVWGDRNTGHAAAVGEAAYGRIVEATQHNRFNGDDVAVTTGWRFDDPGGRLRSRSIAFDGVGLAGDGFNTIYAYDVRGHRSRTDHPVWTGWDASCQEPIIEESYHIGDWLASAQLTLAGTHVPVAALDRAYHPTGRVAEEGLLSDGFAVGAAYEDPDPDGMARPAGLTLWWNDPPGDGVRVWAEGTHGYDGSGNVVSIGSRGYAYDGLDRLVAFEDAGSTVVSYRYDRWGNLTDVENTETGSDLEMIGARFDNRPEILDVAGAGSGNLSWDSRGNLLSVPAIGGIRGKSFGYSMEDRLLRATDLESGNTWRFAYDADGERVLSWRRDGGGELTEIRFDLRDDDGGVLSDWLMVPESFFGPEHDYLAPGGRMAAQLSWSGGEPVAQFAARDHLGSTRVLVDADGTVHDRIEFYPYGGFRSGGPTPGTHRLFTGHQRDLGSHSSELDFMHARHYNPLLGRFTTVDSVRGDPAASQSWNRYAYTSGNPLRAVDPDGRYERDVHYNLTQYLAVQAGYSSSKAELIAGANQGVDDETPANPFKPRNFDLHFLPVARGVAMARSASGPTELGAALHSVQDAFSHAHYKWPLGHGLDNLAGNSPDNTARDPNKAMVMAEWTFKLLGGDPEELDREFLEVLFSVESMEDRREMLEEAVKGRWLRWNALSGDRWRVALQDWRSLPGAGLHGVDRRGDLCWSVIGEH